MSDLIANRYERLEHLGAGAFGDVWKVRDRDDGAIRAVKVLKAGTGSLAIFARFEREFAAIQQISHPNVVKVFDFGLAGEHPYFTMEYLEGTELATFIEQNRPEPGTGDYAEYQGRVAYIFHQVAAGLAAVHAEDIIHRDLKPENVFIRPGRFPRAKLLDFGHARDDDGQDLTKTGTVMGTALYIAPEQAMAGDLQPAADLYAMGCCLYQALVGTPPFTGSNVIEVLMGHIRQPPPDPREFEPRVSDEMAGMCLHLLQKDPGTRPQSGQAVADILGTL